MKKLYNLGYGTDGDEIAVFLFFVDPELLAEVLDKDIKFEDFKYEELKVKIKREYLLFKERKDSNGKVYTKTFDREGTEETTGD